MTAKTQMGFILVILLASCATTPEPEKKGPAEPVFYTLRTAETVKHTAPLPDKIAIFVDWKMSDGSTVSKEGFRGWDIDRDGMFDVLEVLADDGTTTSWAYDFDGDGKVDALEKKESTLSSLAFGDPIMPANVDKSELLKLSH